jgi:hypothetical protein
MIKALRKLDICTPSMTIIEHNRHRTYGGHIWHAYRHYNTEQETLESISSKLWMRQECLLSPLLKS